MNQLDKQEARWFAVFTKYKCEKSVERNLLRKGIQVYLPIQTVIRRYGDRKKRVDLPLISCYVFVRITTAEYVKVLETENVSRFVQFGDELVAIPEREIEILKQVAGDGAREVIAEPRLYKAGDEVEVCTGPLLGLRGKLISVAGKRTFIVELKNVGYSLRIQVLPQYLRKINSISSLL